MNKYGIHLPNGDIRNEAIFDLGVSHFTLLHMQTKYIPRLRQVSPDGIILVRFYLPKWSDTDPASWAAECASLYYAGQMDKYNVHVTPANEMNLVEEGGGWSREWYERINNWLLIWISRFQSLTQTATERIHWPALAYGHSDDLNDDGYIGMEICRPSIEQYGILDVHPYWFKPEQVTDKYFGHRFRLANDRVFNKPIFLSETGNFAVDRESTTTEMLDWFKSLYNYPYVLGGTPFIWEDPTGAHSPNDWARNKELGEALQATYKPPFIPGSVILPLPTENEKFVSPDSLYRVGTGLRELLTANNFGNILWDRSGWDHGVIEKVETDSGYILWAFKENGWQQYVYHIKSDTLRKRVGNQLVII